MYKYINILLNFYSVTANVDITVCFSSIAFGFKAVIPYSPGGREDKLKM